MNVNAHDDSSDCAICARGQYRTYSSNTACLSCAGGRYISDDATDETLHVADYSCLICQYSKYTPSATTGNHQCTFCPAGKNINDHVNNAAYHDQSSDCTVCGTGKVPTSKRSISML